MIALHRQLPTIAALSFVGIVTLMVAVILQSGASPWILIAGAAALVASTFWISNIGNRAVEGKAFEFSALYLAALLFSPPMLQTLPFAARGAKLDQGLLLCSFIFLLSRGFDPFRLIRSNSVVFAQLACWSAAMVTATISLLTITGADAAMAAGALWGQSRPVLVMLVFSSVFAVIPGRVRMRVLSLVLVLGALIILIGFAQYCGWEPVVDLTTTIYTRKADQQAVIDAMSSVGRAYSTFDGQPNAFGTFCMVLFCMSLSLSALRTQARSSRWLVWAMIIASAYGVAISWSRGALAGCLAGAALVLIIVPKEVALRVLALIATAAVTIWQLLPDQTLRRLQDLFMLSTDTGERIYDARLAFWSSNFDFWTRHPVFGGSGVLLAPADSQYLAILISGGVLGLAAFIALVAVVTKKILEVARHAEHPMRYPAIGLTAVVVAMLVNGVSVPSFMEERVMELFWFLVALIVTPLPEFSVAQERLP